ncbi:MAG: DUF1957 domain-containing protein [Acidibacillus sp.]|nr:DUF1957 domain-containing protein [Acidibacillus sp.]
MKQGYLCLVLHAHLPYVRHVDDHSYLEERWFFEALTETYIPIVQVLERLVRDEINFRMTLSISSTLLSMLTDEVMQSRYVHYLETLINLALSEIKRTEQDKDLYQLACYYYEHFTELLLDYQACQGNLAGRLRVLQEQGMVELLTSAATHAYLPLVHTREAIRAQLKTALDLHEKTFGRRPRGIWLPECGYESRIDEILRECGIEFFFTDTHGVEWAQPIPIFGTLSPVLTPMRVAAFARDAQSAKQVWSSIDGYPGDFDYREYYRDIGFDLAMEHIHQGIHPDGIRVNTGIKYYRITGLTKDKKLYDPQRALYKATGHATHFLSSIRQQISEAHTTMGRKPIVVCPYDAELFGHWWYEGPHWLDQVLRQLAEEQMVIQPLTPSEYLEEYNDFQVCELPLSSWGRAGASDVWLQEENVWVYPALHIAERRMIELANRWNEPSKEQRVALNQAARELMLGQSSDWAFIMDNKTMVDYAIKRTKKHVNAFTMLYEMLVHDAIDSRVVQAMVEMDPIFPDVDYQVYRSQVQKHTGAPSVLFLSWEFPPLTVGGLSRHVDDLSRHLVTSGWDVHVVTVQPGDCAADEIVHGVHVYRVEPLQPDGEQFFHWVMRFNLQMLERCQALFEQGLQVDVIHAHDWLVHDVAKVLKKQYQLPLIATIHATEHGRNGGIHTELQNRIHQVEHDLIREAQRVIVCSDYMAHEVITVFSLQDVEVDKIVVIPNGVERMRVLDDGVITQVSDIHAVNDQHHIVFIGRLVREKGVHVLLEAAPDIFADFPNAVIVIMGKGPMQRELQEQARHAGIESRVRFLGFVSDETRNTWLQEASVAVFPSLYEPFGIVALEAMRAHTPVVVADVGGLCEVVSHEQTGLTFFAGNPHSLAHQVKRLLHDKALAQHVIDEAKLMIEREYDWNVLAKNTIHVYEQLLDSTISREAAVR